MDKKNDCKIPECGAVPDLRNRRLAVGAKQLKKALKKGEAAQVFLARNADPSLTEPLEALCLDNQIPVHWVRSMSELGRSCGIEVGAAAAAVLKRIPTENP